VKLIDWIIGREPVATATGIAAVVTAGLGVAAAFGLDVTAEQIAAIGALAAALAGWAGRRAVTPVEPPEVRQVRRQMANQRIGTDTTADDSRLEDGSVPLALIILIGLAVVLMAGLAVCSDALFEDEDEVDDLGLRSTYSVVLVSHERDDCYGQDCRDGGSGDEGDYRDDNRRAGISPGPFDRSPVDFRDNRVTICFPFANCRQAGEEADQPPPEQRTQSLFPPSFEGVKTFVLSTIKSGLEMGRLFAETTITFVENLLFGIA
jgi:hypothetical protein